MRTIQQLLVGIRARRSTQRTERLPLTKPLTVEEAVDWFVAVRHRVPDGRGELSDKKLRDTAQEDVGRGKALTQTFVKVKQEGYLEQLKKGNGLIETSTGKTRKRGKNEKLG
jgi:hypothetical protein